MLLKCATPIQLKQGSNAGNIKILRALQLIPLYRGHKIARFALISGFNTIMNL